MAIQFHLPWFNCPSRKGSKLTPLANSDGSTYRNIGPAEQTATISYGANWGDTPFFPFAGPAASSGSPETDFANVSTTRRSWFPLTSTDSPAVAILPTGTTSFYSEVRYPQIEDGLSNTYLISELQVLNSVDVTLGENFLSLGTPLASGYVLSSSLQPRSDVNTEPVTSADLFNFALIEARLGPMGSSHPTTFNAALCDGSVRRQPYETDFEMHRRLGNRADGNRKLSALAPARENF